MKDDTARIDAPRRHLGMAQATLLALGMIMTTDTLKTAPTVALSIGTWHFYGTWVLGGLISMIGAFCYVEMATAFPDPGGDYNFLRKAWGREVGWLFAWSRFSIMHTGWMALMAFVFFPAPHQLMTNSAAFWFLMQIGMMIGFATSWPANVWLIKRGIKVPM